MQALPRIKCRTSPSLPFHTGEGTGCTGESEDIHLLLHCVTQADRPDAHSLTASLAHSLAAASVSLSPSYTHGLSNLSLPLTLPLSLTYTQTYTHTLSLCLPLCFSLSPLSLHTHTLSVTRSPYCTFTHTYTQSLTLPHSSHSQPDKHCIPVQLERGASQGAHIARQDTD